MVDNVTKMADHRCDRPPNKGSDVPLCMPAVRAVPTATYYVITNTNTNINTIELAI